jgi:ribosome-associated heat shock protein Hsp15
VNAALQDKVMRLDKWLWAARFYKTRSLATDAIVNGRVLLNDLRSKPARELNVGDKLLITKEDSRWEITVCSLSEQRGPAIEAQKLYEETEQSRQSRLELRETHKLMVDPARDIHGRPTKRDRRRLGQLGNQ